MTDCVGTVTRLHGPITPRSPTLHPELPTTSRTSSPPLSPASSQPPSGASAPSRSISRVSSQSASPTSSPVGASSRSGVSSQPPPLSTQPQRWYAITKGRSICVVEGWHPSLLTSRHPVRSNAKPLIEMHPDATSFQYMSERAAIDGLKKAVAEGRVQILD
ncbi:hypothetical protein FIBSPDRAFT_881072 [Athelia psychrophila]|uniref:Uncharacterized protein n=1 Tax=Athelia psychrophila TaxID=1759441 RepID=A0A166X9C7_9AGAM|nr:hypothetical protein FIBSPDRAFT_881072 [Fibularhizoctonia sp. CBS 109695]